MKTLSKIVFACAILSSALAACNNDGGSKEIIALVSERDSLRRTLEQNEKRFEVYNSIVDMINTTLDSMEYHESVIFINSIETPTTQDQILGSLKLYDNLIKRQETRIKQLEEELESSDNANLESKRLVAFFKKEIAQKDEEIKQLRTEIESKDFDISTLRATVNSKNNTITELNRKNSEQQAMIDNQQKALASQDAMLNNGYVIIASKAELKNRNIIKKDKIVAEAALNRSNFTKVDIRTFNDVSFSAKFPRILTNMPASSYRLINYGNNNYKLVIIIVR